ncbi:DUF262 domain-containing protein [Aequorivita marina]|uniref:DUF262 domain-containing protein n=1 Tax=Aequorivita marina TaxID=3073654 RepID=UPI00287660F1|nr:DUF262 domain-containing protein [Aequorivita sp. S2608]MDS1297319.1 DUF262 domain-containing protein [Aequorivita sp. S2608]
MNKYNLLNLLFETIVIKTLDEDKEYTFDGIQIPMIQRDYAHGREGASEIRKRFLNAIFEALEKEEALELDFIYGAVKQLDAKDYFIPLDGQQRLTTLFLFYWYIGNKELLLLEDKLELRNKLLNFTYATRATAREFCQKLCEIELSFISLPSKEIEDSSWFFEIYKLDPTVKSMLVVLDAIHEKYKQSKGDLYSNLSNLKFYLLPLDGFALSDELYIKMNARGKQLTGFENFKADLINWLKDDKNPYNSLFQEKIYFINQEMPYYLAYATKLDAVWANIFWELCVQDLDEVDNKDQSQKNAIIDPYFERFWNRYLLNAFIIKNESFNENIEKSLFFKKFYRKDGEKSLMNYNNFDLHQLIFQQENVIIESEKVLDSLHENYNSIKTLIAPSWNKKDNWSLFDNEINQRHRILFYAITIYLEQNDFEVIKFKNWIRVVWNIIIDPDIRSVGAMINALKLIHQLSIGSNDIYQFLNGKEVLEIVENSNFRSQLEEERLKAQLILSDSNWEQTLIVAEGHLMYRGNIGFLLGEDIKISEFNSKFKIAKLLFDDKGSNNELFEEHLITRALISEIEIWTRLQELNFEDSHFNWQYLLRRNDWVGEAIDHFCSFDTIEKLKEHLEELVSMESNIASWSDENEAIIRARNAHYSVYANGKFHCWLQDPNHKAVNFKWWDHHFFVYRPRSWYDWVMIDIKRNDVVAHLVNDYDFVTGQACNGTHFYAGFRISLKKAFDNYVVNIQLDNHGILKIGFSKYEKDLIHGFDIIEEDNENNITYIKRINFSNVITDTDVTNFMSKVNNEVFSETNENSVFYKIIHNSAIESVI